MLELVGSRREADMCWKCGRGLIENNNLTAATVRSGHFVNRSQAECPQKAEFACAGSCKNGSVRVMY